MRAAARGARGRGIAAAAVFGCLREIVGSQRYKEGGTSTASPDSGKTI